MIIDRNSPKLQEILRRGEIYEDKYLAAVKDILADVKANGDKAVLSYTEKFDKCDYSLKGMQIPQADIKAAYESIDPKLREALTKACERVTAFHRMQLEKTWFHDHDGVLLGQKVTPLDRVGIYVPGGKAAYPSSVIMNAVPAKVAGVKEIIMVTPTPGGAINPAVLAAAHIAGVERIFPIGGAQAVAALAYGTESIPKVDKIVGPGNIYVTLAKKTVFGTVAIDMIAGPSEILVIADDRANPEWVAADMLGQAEHDELASAIAVTVSLDMARRIEAAVKKQLESLSRKDIAAKSLANFSAVIVAKDLEEACDISNSIAPEHLELCVAAPMELMRHIKHAGAIFMGDYTPEAAGDYFAGPNHVLPTGGAARFSSPLGVYDFLKRSSLIYYDKATLHAHSDMIQTLGKAEHLTAHARSVAIRTE